MVANNSIIHGHDKRGMRSKTYASWRSMRERCFNQKNKQYTDYGGRGITVCERWNDFVNFLADMGEVPKGLTLERVDNEKGYSPDNCLWASRASQVRNRRNTKTLEFQGAIKPVAEWAEIMLIPYNTLRCRVAKGWDATKALTTKVMTSDEVSRLGASKRHCCKDRYSKSFPFAKLPPPPVPAVLLQPPSTGPSLSEHYELSIQKFKDSLRAAIRP